MGLSTIYGNIVMLTIFLAVLSVLMGAYYNDLTGTSREVSDQADRLKDRVDSGVKISSISTSTTNDFVNLYVINSGKTVMDANCTDFYLDRKWVKRSDMAELEIVNATFSPSAWDPDETLKMRVQYTTDHDVAHEGRVISCTGVTDSMIFYWAV